jgi:hypothetical protein
MNIRVILPESFPVGATFSQLMVMLTNACDMWVDNIYLQSDDRRFGITGNPFDYLFDQSYDSSYVDIICNRNKSYPRVEEADNFANLKYLVSKLRVKPEILNSVLRLKPYDFAIHIRTGDMNTTHPEYGVFTTADFVQKCRYIVKGPIFVASDNDDAIEKMRKDYEVVTYPCLIREVDETFTTYGMWIKYAYNYQIWQEAMIEMLSLARAKELICRTSNLSNAAILFSNTINQIHRL